MQKKVERTYLLMSKYNGNAISSRNPSEDSNSLALLSPEKFHKIEFFKYKKLDDHANSLVSVVVSLASLVRDTIEKADLLQE